MKILFATIFVLLIFPQRNAEEVQDNRQSFNIVGSIDNDCKQSMWKEQLVLNCSHRNLTYIPKSEYYFQILMFGHNSLVNVTSETFENVSKPEILEVLQLQYNNVKNISANALDAFVHLKIINISGNPIFYNNLRDLLRSLSKLKYLLNLRMSAIHTVTIQKDLFSLMKPNGIETLDLNNNRMRTVSIDSFCSFNSLRVLYLQNNNIEKLNLSRNYHLWSLYIDHNSLNSFPDFSINRNESNCYFPNLKVLTIHSNHINKVHADSFNCLKELTDLEIGENPIKILPNNILAKMTNIYQLELKYMTGDFFQIEQYAFNSSSLTYLQIEFSRVAEAVFLSFTNTFKWTPSLRFLRISRISMISLTHIQLFDLFSPLTELESFKCYKCTITGDPKFIVNNLKSADVIDLQNNQITTLSADTFKQNKKLRNLNLRDNGIGGIQELALPTTFLEKIRFLDLSKNPFVCDCGLEWFISWLKTKQKSKVVKRYPQEYICSYPDKKRNELIANINFTYRECHPWNIWIWVAVIGSPVVVAVAISVFLLYRNRWNIKHYIYLLRKRRNYQAIEGRDYLYDAFVAYESEDSAWVCRTLLPVLEDEVGLKLCIHERDFRAGVFINDNIVNSMNESHKIALVLTNAFARSGWCMFEMKVAHSKQIEEETELVVILLEKIDARNMNNSLRVLFDTTTFIEWTEDVVGQELFWNKLKDALKK